MKLDCGHSICAKCAARKFQESGAILCFLCEKVTQKEAHNLIPDLSMLETLISKPKSFFIETCRTHTGMALDLLCLSCVHYCCNSCALFGDHEGHFVKDIKNATTLLKQEKLEKKRRNVDEHGTVLKSKIEFVESERNNVLQSQDRFEIDLQKHSEKFVQKYLKTMKKTLEESRANTKVTVKKWNDLLEAFEAELEEVEHLPAAVNEENLQEIIDFMIQTTKLCIDETYNLEVFGFNVKIKMRFKTLEADLTGLVTHSLKADVRQFREVRDVPI